MIGQSWSWIMIVSPMVSIYSMISKSSPIPTMEIKKSFIPHLEEEDFDDVKKKIREKLPEITDEEVEKDA